MRDRPAPLSGTPGQAPLLETILPDPVAVVEARGDDAPAPLMPGEEAFVERAVERRRREFATGRACARSALERLGRQPEPLLAGEQGEPLWPAGIVGSITHCAGFRGAAVAPATDLLSIGIDAEPHAPLPERLIGRVGRPEERSRLAALSDAEPEVHWDRLLFSAKEAVYKAWFPLAGRRLGLSDVRVEFDPARRAFEAHLLVEGPATDGCRIDRFGGRWLVRDGLVCTAVAVGGD